MGVTDGLCAKAKQAAAQKRSVLAQESRRSEYLDFIKGDFENCFPKLRVMVQFLW